MYLYNFGERSRNDYNSLINMFRKTTKSNDNNNDKC